MPDLTHGSPTFTQRSQGPTPDDLARARKQLGRKLKERRQLAGLNQSDAAEIAGVSQQTYSRLEKGTAILSWPSLQTLCEYYDCKASDLMPAEQYPSAPADPVERRKFFDDRNAKIREGGREMFNPSGTEGKGLPRPQVK